MRQRFINCMLLLLLVFSACKRNDLDVNVSNVEIDPLVMHRLEKDLFEVTEENVILKTGAIQKKYGVFFDRYVASFLNRGGSRDSLYSKAVVSFVNDKDISNCQKQVTSFFNEERLKPIAQELNKCVKRFKYHFPNKKLPAKYVTCVTGWNFATAYTDSALVTGLDMYLGDTCLFYQMLQLPQYRTRFMNEHFILPDLMRAWIITEFDNVNPTNNLLNYTIFYGKIYYAVNAMLPNIHDSLLMAYTGQQIKYCYEYEKKLWGYFAEKNRLYENNMRQVQELTVEGPFTGAISKECPPRIAMWVGLQIVRSYMKNNDVSLDALMKEADAQKILNKSKYRP
jgi:hypothetical protein